MTSKAAINQLKTVWGKVGLDDVPTPEEASNTLRQSRRQKSDRTAQLNVRVRPEEKRRTELIASREGVTIAEVYSRMLTLYEREHGRVEFAPAKSEEK